MAKDLDLGSQKPRGIRRVIYVSDPSNTTAFYSDPAAQPKEARAWVRALAVEGGADTYVQEIFSEAMTIFWRTDKCPYDVRYWHQRFVPMMDNGLMPIEVLIDESHKQGMEFIAGFRMNDRHGQHPDFFEKLSKEHPDWILTDFKPSWGGAPARSHEYGCSLDYSKKGVRDWLFATMEEVANRFDVDGIEFNFTRLAECFPKGKAEERHAVMTGFIRRVREMLDEAGKKRGNLKEFAHDAAKKDSAPGKRRVGRKLIFGVRVPQQLEGNKKMGFDIPTWIKDRLIDYVAPGDFGFTDFNEKYEDFARLARAHDCHVYPQVQARLGFGKDQDQSLDQYRAALQNFYGAGADGFSTQNYFFLWGPQFAIPGEDGLKSPDMFVKALNYLKILRDPNQVAAGDRHYVFYPLYRNFDPKGEGISGIYKTEKIVLDRRKLKDRGDLRFRICENLPPDSNVRHGKLISGAMLLFRPRLLPGDEIELDINGTKIPGHDIQFEWGGKEGDYPVCKLALNFPPMVYGDNFLGLMLIKSSKEAQGDVVLDEVEIFVKAD